MITLAAYYPYFFVTILQFILYYFIGHLTIALVEKKFDNFFEDFFFKNIIGCVLSTVLFAVVKSGGQTVMSIALLLGILMLFFNTKLYSINIKANLKVFPTVSSRQVGILLAVIVGITMLKIIKSIDSNYGLLFETYLEVDYCYYAQLADFFNLYGIENTQRALNLVYQDFQGLSPYHYFEIWQTAFWINLTGYNATYLFIFPCAIYWLVLLFIGYFILLKHFIHTQFDIPLYLLAFSFLFFTAIPTDFFMKIPIEIFSGFAYHFIHGLWTIPIFDLKRSIVEVYFLTIFILAIKESKQNTLFAVCFLPIFSILLAPACLGAVFLFTLNELKQKKIVSKEIFAGLALPIIIGMSMLLLFIVLAPKTSLHNSLLADSMSFLNKPTDILQAVLQRGSNHFIQKIGIFFPFPIVFMLWVYRDAEIKKLQYFFHLMLLILGIGLVFGSLSNYFNWDQFFTVVVFPIGKIMFVVFSLLWLSKELYSLHLNWKVGLLFLLTSWHLFRTVRHMQLYIKPTEKLTEKNKNWIEIVKNKLYPLMGDKTKVHTGVFYYSDETIKNLYFFTQFNIYHQDYHLSYLIPNLHLANYSYDQYHRVNNYQRFAPEVESSINSCEINLFIKIQSSKNIFKDTLAAKIDYLKAAKVSLLIADKDAKVEKEVIEFFTDSIINPYTYKRIYYK